MDLNNSSTVGERIVPEVTLTINMQAIHLLAAETGLKPAEALLKLVDQAMNTCDDVGFDECYLANEEHTGTFKNGFRRHWEDKDGNQGVLTAMEVSMILVPEQAITFDVQSPGDIPVYGADFTEEQNDHDEPTDLDESAA